MGISQVFIRPQGKIRTPLKKGDLIAVQWDSHWSIYQIDSNIDKNTDISSILGSNLLIQKKIVKNFNHFTVYSDTNPDPEDKELYIPGSTWYNCRTGEIFVLHPLTINNCYVWEGNKGTFIAQTFENVADIFGDNSCIAFFEFNDTIQDSFQRYKTITFKKEVFDVGLSGKCIHLKNSQNLRVTDFKGSLTGDLTFSCWFQIDRFSDGCLFSLDSFKLKIGRSQILLTIKDTTSHYDWISRDLTKWNHIICDTQGRVFLNGNQIIQHSETIKIKETKHSLVIGSCITRDDLPFDYLYCKLDNLRVFNKTLHTSEIKFLYSEFKNLR